MITYYTTFERFGPTWYSSVSKESTLSFVSSNSITSASTYGSAGTYVSTYIDTNFPTSTTSQSATSTSGTYTYSEGATYSGTYTYTSTLSTGTSTSSSSLYSVTESSFLSSIYYTQLCDLPYEIVTSSSQIISGTLSFNTYQTITHNSPSPHSISQETWQLFTHTTSSSYSTGTTTSQTYSTTASGFTTTTETLTGTAYTTGISTYTTTNSFSSTGTYTGSATQAGVAYETLHEGETIIDSRNGFSITSVQGQFTYITTSEYYTLSYLFTQSAYFTFNDTFSLFNGANNGYSSASQYISRSQSYLNSGVTTSALVSLKTSSSYFLSSPASTAITQAGSTSATQDGVSSSTAFSFSTNTTSSLVVTSSTSFDYGIFTSLTSAIPYSYTTYSELGNAQTSTTVSSTYFVTTGTTSSTAGSTVNTTRSTYFSTAKQTSTTASKLVFSWFLGNSTTYSNTVLMSVARGFARTPEERMFSLSSTNTAFIKFGDAVKETTQFVPTPQYTSGSSFSFESYSTNLAESVSWTTKTGSTKTAFQITNYSYDLGSVTISQSDGTVLSPVGAYGQSATSISYSPGIYDITSRTLSDTDVSTNTTQRTTITGSLFSETITNADKHIYPILTISATTTTSSETIFSLLGAIAFNTTSLASP